MFLVVSTLGVYGQQDPQFTQNFGNKLYNNPAFAGMNDAICATLIGRQQWLGFDGAPRTGVFSIHSPIRLYNTQYINPSVGFSAANDQIGPISTNVFKLAISNQFILDNIGVLSAGIGVGTMGVSIDGTKFIPTDGPLGTTIDENLSNVADAKDYGLDFDFGLYFKSADDKIFAGVSYAHLTQSQLQGKEVPLGGVIISNSYQIKSHIYAMGGYKIQGLVPNWEFVPSIFLKTDLATTQFDFNVRGIYNQKLWAGLSYRLQDAVAPMVGYMHDFGSAGVGKIGVAYDVNTSKLNKHNSGTIEIFLNYCFKITPKPKISIHKNPRWL